MSVDVKELTAQIKAVEGIDVGIAAPAGTMFEPYSYTRAAWGTMTVAELKQKRLIPAAKGYTVDVFDANGQIPNGRTKIETIRKGYSN